MIFYYWLVAILPLVNHPLWGRLLGPFTIFEYIGILALLYAVFHAMMKGALPAIFSTAELRLTLVLYVLAFVSALVGPRGITLRDPAFIIYTSSFMLVVITIALVDTLERLRFAVLTLIGSYAFASLYVLREWEINVRMGWYTRPGWMVGDSNYFATASIYAIALAFYLIQARRPRWEKWYLYACVPVMIVGNMACASRGGFLGLCVAALWFVGSTKNRARNLVLITVLILPLALFMPLSPLHRFLNSKADLGSTQAHELAWVAGWHMIEAHPILGVGLGQFKPMMPSYLPPGVNVGGFTVDTLAHNMFVEIAAELGLPAFLIFCSMLGFCYRSLTRVKNNPESPPYLQEIARALRAGLVGASVSGCFVSAEYQKTTWMGLALVMCMAPLARIMVEQQKGAPEQTSSSDLRKPPQRIPIRAHRASRA